MSHDKKSSTLQKISPQRNLSPWSHVDSRLSLPMLFLTLTFFRSESRGWSEMFVLVLLNKKLFDCICWSQVSSFFGKMCKREEISCFLFKSVKRRLKFHSSLGLFSMNGLFFMKEIVLWMREKNYKRGCIWMV